MKAIQTMTLVVLASNVITAVANNFGGPDTVENQIAEDAATRPAMITERASQSWFDWKAAMQKDHGLWLGVDYSAVYLGATDALANDSASGGMIRFLGSWELVGRGTKNTGALVWKVENRHAYVDNPPSDFGLEALGYVGFIAPPWNDQGSRMTNLYWRQRFNEGRSTFIGGYLDVTDHVDVFAGGSPWTGFQNLVFSTGSASIFLPNESTPGLAGATMLTDNVYMIGGIANAYSDPTNPFEDSFNRFFSDSEYFASLEIGRTKGQEQIYLDNSHLTFWHVDDSIEAGAIDGWGVAFSHIDYIYNKWMPFIRGGYAKDGGTLLQKSLSLGFLYQAVPGAGLLGVGINWGEVNESSFDTGLDDQIAVEAFYRFQLTQQIAITSSIEYIDSPALNPEHDNLWVVGLRVRVAF